MLSRRRISSPKLTSLIWQRSHVIPSPFKMGCCRRNARAQLSSGEEVTRNRPSPQTQSSCTPSQPQSRVSDSQQPTASPFQQSEWGPSGPSSHHQQRFHPTQQPGTPTQQPETPPQKREWWTDLPPLPHTGLRIRTSPCSQQVRQAVQQTEPRPQASATSQRGRRDGRPTRPSSLHDRLACLLHSDKGLERVPL